MNDHKQKSITSIFQEQPDIAEKFHILCSNLLAMREEHPIQSIILSSSIHMEGTSTVCALLAVALASINQKVLLIDANFHNPIQHHFFNIHNHLGFQEYLSSYSSLQDVIVPTEVPNLSLITSGPIRQNNNSRHLFSQISTFLRDMLDEYDFILIDTPPVNAFSDVQNILRFTDGCLLVVRSDHTNASEVKEASRRIRNVKGKILGVILNDFD